MRAAQRRSYIKDETHKYICFLRARWLPPERGRIINIQAEPDNKERADSAKLSFHMK
jgi:hypothetical protein